MINTKSITVLFSIAILLNLSACAELKETGRTIGHATKDITTEIGHTSRDAAKEIKENLSEESN